MEPSQLADKQKTGCVTISLVKNLAPVGGDPFSHPKYAVR